MLRFGLAKYFATESKVHLNLYKKKQCQFGQQKVDLVSKEIKKKKNNLDVNQLTFEPSLIKVCRVALEKFCGLQIENLWNLAPYKGSAMEELREK